VRLLTPRRVLALISGVLIVIGISLALSPGMPNSRDVLWHIVTNCLDPTVADYCERCNRPRIDSSCLPRGDCENTIEVWAADEDYAVIRDIKMCGCPEEFLHGLILPRWRVTGVEDPGCPDGIWEVAWDVACKRIKDESSIALVVNPKGWRSQDQLHVHVVRLRQDARQKFDKLTMTRVQCLDEVWTAASQRAASEGLDDYGVLVASNPQGGFMLLVEKYSPERMYTEERCR
jgi:CDP-diacylglycerol pyrophosphatase